MVRTGQGYWRVKGLTADALGKAKFAGNAACASCHTRATQVWKHSLHAKALETLQKRAHDRDPDCLPCHVVGLSSRNGYRSPKLTPQLAFVGCESCHGSGADHAKDPFVRLGKVGEKACSGTCCGEGLYCCDDEICCLNSLTTCVRHTATVRAFCCGPNEKACEEGCCNDPRGTCCRTTQGFEYCCAEGLTCKLSGGNTCV